VAKLIVGRREYQSISSTAFYESEYEALVLGNAHLLFPDHVVVPFKPLVESEFGRAKPDLALIDRRYRKWWVVEVELAHHPLAGHVLPQIAVLADAEYGAGVATYLSLQSSDLDSGRLENMMRGSQPQVLVVVNKAVPQWLQPLSAYGAILAIVEVFRSDRNEHALRMNGDYPDIPTDLVSTLRFDPNMPRLMIVDSPGALDIAGHGAFEIDFEGSITEWTRITTRDRVWLNPLKTNPLPMGQRYALTRGDDGQLRLEKAR